MDLHLRDKVILLAGSTRGIGLATARAFLSEGAKVIVTGRNNDSLNAARDKLSGNYAPSSMLFLQADMTRTESIEDVVQKTLSTFQAIDVVVANVGRGSGINKGWQLTPKDWIEVFDINFMGSMAVAAATLPSLLQSRGNLIFVSSIAGHEDLGAPIPYTAAKAALEAAMKALSRKLAPEGVRINSVAPGNILFPGGSWEKKLQSDRKKIEDYIQSEVPLGRFGTPEEISDTILFLASSRAPFVTGTCIVADGGQTRTI